MLALPTVSAVIPAYNVEAYLADTLKSIQRQTLEAFEVIVVDDASTDRTTAVVAAIASTDSRVRLVRREQNGGVCRARNAGIAVARAPWLAFVDGDDWLEPSRLATMVQTADALRADWLADDQLLVACPGVAPTGRVLRGEPPGARIVATEHLIARDPPETVGYGTLKPLVRSAFVQQQGIRFRTGLERFEDFVFHVECGLRGGRMALLNRPLYYYRRRPDSLTSMHASATLAGMLRQNLTILGEATALGRGGAVAALQHRDRLIRQASEYRALVGSLRSGAYATFAARLIERPATSGSLARGLVRAATRRFGIAV